MENNEANFICCPSRDFDKDFYYADRGDTGLLGSSGKPNFLD